MTSRTAPELRLESVSHVYALGVAEPSAVRLRRAVSAARIDESRVVAALADG